jgi:hypothetical protein
MTAKIRTINAIIQIRINIDNLRAGELLKRKLYIIDGLTTLNFLSSNSYSFYFKLSSEFYSSSTGFYDGISSFFYSGSSFYFFSFYGFYFVSFCFVTFFSSSIKSGSLLSDLFL